MKPTQLELTILMPCLNEAETLQICIKKALGFIQRNGIAGEVLIADNGSTDGSQRIAEDAGARVVDIDQKGYGAALAGGIASAFGRFVIMGDADDSYDFEHLENFVKELRDGADLVMGNRFAGGIKPGAMPPLHRYLGNPVLSFAGRLFFGSKIGDFHCGLRGFRRDTIRGLNLRTTGMEFASEMVVKATLAGLKIKEVPTTLSPDGRSRAPHLRSFRDGWRHLRFLLLFSPRWLFLYPGIVLLFLGLCIFAVVGPGPIRVTPELELDIHTLFIGMILVLVGLQSISFGMIARQFATRYGFIPPSSSWAGMLEKITLERLLLIAVTLCVLGVIGIVGGFVRWAQLDFGPLIYADVFRLLIASATALVTGVQLMLVGFLSSLIAIPLAERRFADSSEQQPAKSSQRRAGEA